MRRREAVTINNQTIAINQQAKNDLKVTIEIDPKLLSKLETNNWYEHKDIAKVAEYIIKSNGYDFENQFEVISDCEHLKVFLNERFKLNNSPCFIIYNIDDLHWVTFALVKLPDHAIKVLYKDSMGDFANTQAKVQEAIRDHFANQDCRVDFLANSNKEQEDDYSCGPMSLNNMAVIIQGLKNEQSFMDEFNNVQFCSQSQVESVKKNFKNNLQKKLIQNINQDIEILAKDEAFKVVIKDIVSEAVKLEPLLHAQNKYFDVLKEELEKKEKDPQHSLDKNKLESAKAAFYSNIHLTEKLQVLFSPETKELEEKLQKLHNIFALFNYCKVDDDLYSNLESVSKKLGIEANQLKKLYDINNGLQQDLANNDKQHINTTNDKKRFDQIKSPGYWYVNDDMNDLLNIELANQASVMAPVKFLDFIELSNNIRYGLEKLKISAVPIVMPINLHENHWAALIIKKTADCKFQVIYNNPKGSSLQNEPHADKFIQIITEILGENTDVIDLQLAQQNNDNDCGPFTVDNIISLSKAKTASLNRKDIQLLPPKLNTGDAKHLRHNHANILLCKSLNLPEIKVQENIIDICIKPLDQLLVEIKLLSEGEKSELRENYNKVKEYNDEWNNKTAIDIQNWANEKKGHLTTAEIYETIAIMDRANELATGGHKLRDTQILSILAFLQAGENKGRLCEIGTGEGKTTIVSLLATIKVLQGEVVDVITSNEVLAAEGAKDKNAFYKLFNISVAHNNADKNYIYGARECYKADVLYGNIGNFQFDYLRDSFEGHKTRAKRKFSNVILDEVDSMLIDNSGHIAKLSGPFPGMDSLRYIHIKIWQELHKAENALNIKFQGQLKAKAQQLHENNIPEEIAQAEYNDLCQELANSFTDKLKAKIKASNPTNIDLIPQHLKVYAERKLDKWLDNAIHAKYTCNENEHYIIRQKSGEEQNGEEVIIPVDYANTGVTMQNTVWSYGLHQFVQLKHNLEVTPESLTSSFISNLGYIKKYGKKIFGSTGTLGSKHEQGLLSAMYEGLDYFSIPTFKTKSFTEHLGKVVKDDEWSAVIALDAIDKIESGRAVLIICQTIKDLNSIKQNLELLKKITNLTYRIKEYPDESSSHITKEELQPGDIIIATNIAGRGTDLKTNQDLEKNGGLHVCVGFLPCNKRVQDQAFGRTARQGNEGTAELVIRESEVVNLGIDIKNRPIDNIDFADIKQKRDKLEQKRIEEIKAYKINEINFQDELFSYFSELYSGLKQKTVANKKKPQPEFRFALDDLKECWAFWLEKHVLSQTFSNKEEMNAKLLFEKFKTEATDIINGEIKHNPYNNIHLAEHYLEKNGITNQYIDKAKAALDKALKMSTTPDILYSAYFKQFEVAMESGGVLLQRFKDAMAKVAIFGYFCNVKNEDYKKEAKQALEKAKQALEKETFYLNNNFFAENAEDNKDFRSILVPNFVANKICQEDKTDKIPTEEKTKENLLIKHLRSRLLCLDTYSGGVTALLEEIEKPNKNGLAINSRIPDYLKKLEPISDNEIKFKQAITNAELSDLENIGLDTIYALREVHDVPTEIIAGAQGQILTGLALLAASAALPPVAIITAPLGNTMIFEGISDIVLELISKGNQGFDVAAYAKSKAISYGISLATMGLSALATCEAVLERAIKACKGLAEMLRKSPFMKNLCEKIATNIDKLGQWFEKLRSISQFNKLSRAEQLQHLQHLKNTRQFEKFVKLEKLTKLKDLSKLAIFTTNLSNAVVSSGKSIAFSIFMEKVVTASLYEFMQGLKPTIKSKIKKELESNLNLEKLKIIDKKDIEKSISEMLSDSIGAIIVEVAYEITMGVFRHFGNWKLQLTLLAIDSVLSYGTIVHRIYTIANKLNEQLNKLSGSANNDANKIIESISEKLTEIIYNRVVALTGKIVTTLPKVGYGAYQDNKNKKEEAKRKKQLTFDYEAQRMWASVDGSLEYDKEKDEYDKKLNLAYKTLGVNENSTEKEIKYAYHKAALKNHPDKGGPPGDFQDVGNAYALLNKRFSKKNNLENTSSKSHNFTNDKQYSDVKNNNTNNNTQTQNHVEKFGMRANNNPNALVTNVDNISNNNRDNMELVERYAITHTETNGKNKRWLQSESDSINKPFNEEAQRLNIVDSSLEYDSEQLKNEEVPRFGTIVDGSNTQIQNRVEKFGMSENNNLKSKKTPVTRTAAYTKGRKNSQRRGKKNAQGRTATNQQPTSFVPAKRHLDITAPEITEIGFHSSSRKYIRSGINDHPTDQRGINCVPIAVAHTVNYYSPATDVHTSTDIYGNVIGPLTLDDAKESLKRKNIDFAQSDLDIKNIDANIKNSNAKSGIILFSREREMGHAVHIRVLNGKVHITDDQRSGRIATRQQPTGVDLECYLNQNSANGKVIFLDTDQINCLNNSFSRVSLVDQHSDYMDIGYGSGKKCDPNGVKITIAEQFNVNPNNSLIRDNMEYVERYARNPKLNKIIEITEKSKPQDIPGNADVRIHALKGNLEGLNSVDIKKDTAHMPQHQQNPGNARLLFIYKNSKIKWLGVGDTHGDNVKEWDQIEKDNATSGYLCFTNKKNNIKYGIKKVKL